MEDKGGILDRHKSAAVFMISFLDRFDCPPDVEKNIGINLLKERLAVIFGTIIMVTLLYGELEEWKRKDAAGQITDEGDKLKYEECKETVAYLSNHSNSFSFPAIICDTKKYPHNFALELHYAQKENRLFVLSLANELFGIERYNRQLAEIDRLKQMLKKIIS